MTGSFALPPSSGGHHAEVNDASVNDGKDTDRRRGTLSTSMNETRRRLAIGLPALVLSRTAMSGSAPEAGYPNRPIRIVVGYAPGGAADTLARLAAARLAEALGQPVLVENRPGANSNLGAVAVARSAPDGYTLYVLTPSNTINRTLYSNPWYDPIADFAPVGMIARIPNVLVVNPALPIHSVADYVDFARKSERGVTFASSGTGSSIHMSGEMFKLMAGVNMLHVPYRGSAPAVADLIGGQVHSMFDNAPSAVPHVRARQLRALAVTSAQRSPYLPDIPTLAESGFPGFDVQSWFGLVAPAGTPAQVIARLNRALNAALADPGFQERLTSLVATPSPMTPEEMGEFIRQEVAKWEQVVRAARIRVE